MLVSWSISSKVPKSSGRSSQSKSKGFVVRIFTLCSCWPVGILSPFISRIFMLSLSLVPTQVWHAWRFISTKISTKRQVRGILIMSWEDATKNQDIWKFFLVCGVVFPSVSLSKLILLERSFFIYLANIRYLISVSYYGKWIRHSISYYGKWLRQGITVIDYAKWYNI